MLEGNCPQPNDQPYSSARKDGSKGWHKATHASQRRTPAAMIYESVSFAPNKRSRAEKSQRPWVYPQRGHEDVLKTLRLVFGGFCECVPWLLHLAKGRRDGRGRKLTWPRDRVVLRCRRKLEKSKRRKNARWQLDEIRHCKILHRTTEALQKSDMRDLRKRNESVRPLLEQREKEREGHPSNYDRICLSCPSPRAASN
jgi:hypothetical protein